MRIVTAEQMREMDRYTIETLGVPSLELMERAGAAVALWATLPSREGAKKHTMRVAVVCGRGNNGGDGWVAARHIAAVPGFQVTVFPVADKEDCSPDCREMWGRVPGKARVHQPSGGDFDLAGFNVIVDAVYGTGYDASRPADPDSPEERALRAIVAQQPHPFVVAVDVPSSLDATTGESGPNRPTAAVTVTFQCPKRGMFHKDGPDACGLIAPKDLGIEGPRELTEAPTFITPDSVTPLFPHFPASTHKGLRGHILTVGGSTSMPGAPALCAFAALRAGAGLSTCAVPESIHPITASYRPELMTVPLPDGGAGCLIEEGAERVMEMLDRFHVLALGPGLTAEPPARAAVKRLVESSPIPVVLDADGLNCLAQLGPIEHLAPLIITPHPGEMARLLGTDVETVQADRFESARRAATKYAATAVLKGVYTVISSETGDLAVNHTGSPGLATAGSGDVLTGVIAALVHLTGSPYDAARGGVYMHGEAGDTLERLTAAGFTALDIARMLPEVRGGLSKPEGDEDG